jgi:hypothetical protein
MWHKFLEWLIGCPRCIERQGHIDRLEAQLKDALDRVMSRDYGQYGLIRADIKGSPVKEVIVDRDHAKVFGDGLDE